MTTETAGLDLGHHPQILVRRIKQLEAPGGRVRVVVAIAEETVPTDRGHGKSRRPCIAERHVDGRFAAKQAVVACFDSHMPAKFVDYGVRGDHVHDAAGGVAAVERTLRPAQQFHAGQIEVADHAAFGAEVVHAIRIQGDSLLTHLWRQVESRAAHGYPETARRAHNDRAWNVLQDLLDIDKTLFTDHVAGDLLDRYGNILQALLALFCSDDNFFELRVCRRTGKHRQQE